MPNQVEFRSNLYSTRSMTTSNLMKNVPLNQFIGLPFDWIEEQRASAGGRIFQSQWSMDHSVPKIAQIDRRFKRSTYENQKSLPVWLVMCLGFENWQADYLVDWWGHPKPFFSGPRPGVCFDSPFFENSNFLPKKLDFSNLRNFTPEQPSEARPRSSTPKMATRLRKYKLFSYFLPPDSLALLLQRGFLSYTEPRWFERFFRG